MKRSKDLLRKTNLGTFYAETEELFGKERGLAIYADTLSGYADLRIHSDDRGEKSLRNHLNGYILPTVALYRAMQKNGIPRPEAKETIDALLDRRAKAEAVSLHGLRRIPFPLFRGMFKMIMKGYFPTAGWDTVWILDEKRVSTCVCRRCFYLETLTALDARELCAAFCQTDVTSYGGLAPEIVFERKNTLEKGGKACDFTFRKESMDK